MEINLWIKFSIKIIDFPSFARAHRRSNHSLISSRVNRGLVYIFLFGTHHILMQDQRRSTADIKM